MPDIFKTDFRRFIKPYVNSPFVLLETSAFDKANKQSYFFTDFLKTITFYHNDNPQDFFNKIDECLQSGLWLAGYFAYEFGYYLEPALYSLRKKDKVPLAWLGVCHKPITIKHLSSDDHKTTSYAMGRLAPNISYREYCLGIGKIKRYLKEGLTYQVNFTFKNKFNFKGDSIDFYLNAKKTQPTAYTSFINTGDVHVLSFSPELFFRLKGERIIVKPMKGTVGRGLSESDDRQKRNWLEKDKKARAENIMIVDLLRNDLSRFSKQVKTTRLFETEKHRTLYQLTSTVEAVLKKNAKISDIFFSLFPSGSVTGAPKINTMMLINDLEKEPRGVYTGAIGYMKKNEACFNVAIRTVELRGGKGKVGVGGGIVDDSKANLEFREACLKSRFLEQGFKDFMLIESILWEKGKGCFLLDLHLDRLRKSCDYFSIRLDEKKLKQDLRIFLKSLPEKKLKIRINVDIEGKFNLGKEPLEEIAQPVKVKLSEKRIMPEDIFLYHKTNQRYTYDKERKRAKKEGFFEVVFLNKRLELTEGAITNIFLLKESCLFTPPVYSGLLDGVLRRHLIDIAKAREKVLYAHDLAKADKIYIGNSVRGLLEARVYTK
jgi:para-aminobenzoate synthetase/4-amino-4-deoxychorismate lyase